MKKRKKAGCEKCRHFDTEWEDYPYYAYNHDCSITNKQIKKVAEIYPVPDDCPDKMREIEKGVRL